jgi:uncharacterized protein (TIGR03435 family)
MRQLLIAGLLLSIAGRASAQDVDSSVTFEAVSIKPFPEGTPILMSGCPGGPGSDDPGQINCVYVTVKTLLMRAYKVRNQEISGPGWIDSAHYNIVAKVPQGATGEQVAVMFRNLLADRFKVVLHHETKPMTAYPLTVAKNGPKLKEYDPAAAATDDAPPAGGKLPTGEDGFPILRRSVIASGPIILYRQGRARLQAGNTKLAKIAEALSNQLDQVVTDETGLTASYDITLYWTPDATEVGGHQPGVAPQEAGAAETSLFSAVEQQLGLKLVAKKVPRDILVIDRAEKTPTGN